MSSVTRAGLDHKLAMAKRCAHEGVMAGAKAAVVATVAAAIPTVSITDLRCNLTCSNARLPLQCLIKC
ncbi:hypothetical protein BHE74_00003331 [Ensete ventricosum]|nr:hypothetical protein BHE74_00003331 [Ensete ventricosum]